VFFVRGFLGSAAAPAAPVAAAAAKKAVAAAKPTPPPATPSNHTLPLIFLVLSAGCMVAPFYQSKMAQRSCYALTSRRALVIRGGLFGPTRESYQASDVAQMRRDNSWVCSGGGDLIFRTVVVVTTSYNQKGGSRRSVNTKHYGFLAITNIAEVEKLVRDTLINPYMQRMHMANNL
jgi:hypothetical protein